MKKLIITGGGSGGHTMPAIAIIESLLSKFDENSIDILYVGSKKGIEKKITAENNIRFKSISTGKLRRYFSFENFIDLFKVVKGIFDSFFLVIKYKPDLVFSTGGFVSVPMVIAAHFCKVKVLIHEQTVDAGLANKIAGKFADKVALTFEDSKKYFQIDKTVVTGIPLRNAIFNGDGEKAFDKFGFDKKLPVLYISGGGLGCHVLNETLLNILPKLLNITNIVIQTGNANDGMDYNNLKEYKESLSDELKKRVQVFNFIGSDLGDIFAMTDLVVARSGAGTVNELIALKIPAIFIPLAIATNDEQTKNAMIMKNKETAIVIKETELNGDLLYDTIYSVLMSEKLVKMKEKFVSFGDFRGNDNLVKEIFNMLKVKI